MFLHVNPQKSCSAFLDPPPCKRPPRTETPKPPNVSKYTRSVSDGFLYALEACLINLGLP